MLGFAADLKHRIGASYRKCSSVLLTLTGLVVSAAALVLLPFGMWLLHRPLCALARVNDIVHGRSAITAPLALRLAGRLDEARAAGERHQVLLDDLAAIEAEARGVSSELSAVTRRASTRSCPPSCRPSSAVRSRS